MVNDKQVFCPDVVHQFAIDFINRHKDQPFFVYYASHLVHVPMERTPDSKPGTTDATSYNHYGLLCSVEDVFHLEHLGFASAPGTPCFGDDVYNG